jgi:hypothetical protein
MACLGSQPSLHRRRTERPLWEVLVLFSMAIDSTVGEYDRHGHQTEAVPRPVSIRRFSSLGRYR